MARYRFSLWSFKQLCLQCCALGCLVLALWSGSWFQFHMGVGYSGLWATCTGGAAPSCISYSGVGSVLVCVPAGGGLAWLCAVGFADPNPDRPDLKRARREGDPTHNPR